MIHRRVSMGKAPHNNNNYRIVVLFFLIYLTTGKYRAKIEHCYFLSLSNGQVINHALPVPAIPIAKQFSQMEQCLVECASRQRDSDRMHLSKQHKILCFLIKLEFFEVS
jgi:hypothetical protein